MPQIRKPHHQISYVSQYKHQYPLLKKTNNQTNKKTKNDNHDVTLGFESQSNWVSGVNNDFSRIHNPEGVMGC